MTSIHFVVHPLPGTEDQLNDRYFVGAVEKIENRDLRARSGIGFSWAYFHTMSTLAFMCIWLLIIEMTPWVESRPGFLNDPR